MDLGFGGSNQVLGNAVASSLQVAAKAQEDALDGELAKYDELLENDDALDFLREKRLQQLKAQQKQQQEWMEQGHGEYKELESKDVAKAFFESSKNSARLVVHFYRPTTRYCDVFHRHLSDLSKDHIETKFVKINVESGNPGLDYLVEKLGIVIIPSLLLVVGRKAVHHIRGFDELGGSPDFSTTVLKWLMVQHGAIFNREELDEDQIREELEKAALASVNSINLKAASGIRDGFHYDD